MSDLEWEKVIGLEIHVQLKTRSKIFAQSTNHFGDEPNTNIEIVDTGQPGALPILNEETVNIARRFGCAIHATIAPYSTFDRKSYFYPDSPRNFQITQFHHPIVIGGHVTTHRSETPKTFAIHHAHLEDDAGMLRHFSDFAGVDYNRAGVPLLEIVSQPCMHSADDAIDFAMTLKAIMEYLDVSNCNMEEGSMRIDTNISVRRKGEQTLRNKVEIKNLNSFTHMRIGIEAEVKRQIAAYEEYEKNTTGTTYLSAVPSATMRLDVENKKTIVMRLKEEAQDYCYMHEPDLPPIITTEAMINDITKHLPELPQQRFDRYVNTLKLSAYNAAILVTDKQLSDYYEKALTTCDNATALCNWVTVEFVGRFKNKDIALYESKILPSHIASLVNSIDKNIITGRIAKEIATIMSDECPGKNPDTIIAENPNFQAMNDTSSIEPFVNAVLEEHGQSVIDFKNGKDKAFNFLVGQVMKRSKGKASPEVVKNLITEKIKNM